MRTKMTMLPLALIAPLFGSSMFAQIPQPTDAPQPLTPEQAAASYKLPPGFRLEVVASEPLISSPSAVCWDERGRMFVSELHGYNLEGQLDIEDLNKSGQLDTQVRRVQADEKFKRAAEPGTYGVVKLLLDENGDGRMDKAITWSTNLPPAYGLVPARGGVIVACAPHIVFLADRNDDGLAEVHEQLFTGFRTGALERGINAPQWGNDGWIYFGRGWGGGKITGPYLKEPVDLPGSDFRIRADGSAIEPVTGSTHTFGFALTEAGDRFTVTTTSPGIYSAPLPWRYLVRNPNAATSSLENPTGDRRAYSISKPHPWRQKRADDPEYFKYYSSRYGPAESEADGWFTAACSPLIYLDRVLPGLHGQYFVCEPAGNLIHRAMIEEEGSVLKLRRAPGEEKSEFAASTDPWTHPMNLTHGPDGCIWITDYYREIIEDYSAIPRHLQQQYGVYRGHDRGRIYRLTHPGGPKSASADLSKLDPSTLALECSSPILWRRQTAQRLLIERKTKTAESHLREILRDETSASTTLITALHSLDQLEALHPHDLNPFITHSSPAVRVHALQLADRSFANDNISPLLETALAAAARESNARVLIQFALSLGESRDPRAFAMLKHFAREKLSLRWMDSAILSSLARREADFLSALLREPGTSRSFLAQLAQAIAASQQEADLARTLKLLGYSSPETQSIVLEGLAKGRKNAPRKQITDHSARSALETFARSTSGNVSKSAQALAQTFVSNASDENSTATGTAVPDQITEDLFHTFITALSASRDLNRGHELFLQACSTCHRIGAEGHEVGPDLIGQLGMGEEALLKDLLLPSERIRPGYETIQVSLRDGSILEGILKEEGPTSLLVVQSGAVEQPVLRKDIATVRHLATSLMPSFAQTLDPADAAHLLAWLRSNLSSPPASPQTPAN